MVSTRARVDRVPHARNSGTTLRGCRSADRFPASVRGVADPADPDQVFRATSPADLPLGLHLRPGCPGIYTDRPTTAAARWARTSPTRRRAAVDAAVRQLTGPSGSTSPPPASGWAEFGIRPGHSREPPDRKTRIVDGACIFLTGRGSPVAPAARCTCSRWPGPGAERHQARRLLAAADPRQYARDPDDETTYTEVTVGEVRPRRLGARGAIWTGTAPPHQAHHGRQPFIELAAELSALMGGRLRRAVELGAEFASGRDGGCSTRRRPKGSPFGLLRALARMSAAP